MELNELSARILACAFKVHTELGPGLLESAYEECLNYELLQSGLAVYKQKPLPLTYKEIRLDAGFRVDLMVENTIVVEVKSVEALRDIHAVQVLTYLKLSGCKIGLLLNFNEISLKNGIRRFIV